jgi:aminoglycoside phosphotransferase (APT) family kinase protein
MSILSWTSPNHTEITRIIHTLYPGAQAVRHIEHGYENYIVIVDDRYVVRFPRNEAVWSRAMLEQFVLSKLNLPIVPKVIRYSDNPPYLVQTFLPGEHISETAFRQLPVAVQRSIGSQIAEFAYALHSAISVDTFSAEQAKLMPREGEGSYRDYLQKTLQAYTFPTEAQDKVARRYYAAWEGIKPSKPVVVHDDLHAHNLLFDEERLSGVVDFGAISIGTAEQELRQVYRLSDEALASAVKTYNALARTDLDIEASRIWAATQELAAYAREIQAGQTAGAAFKRAGQHLALWFPGVFEVQA